MRSGIIFDLSILLFKAQQRWYTKHVGLSDERYENF